MDAASVLAAWLPGAGPLVFVALLARIAIGMEMAAPALLPTVEMRTRLGFSLLLTLAALPAALTTSLLAVNGPAAVSLTGGGTLAAIAGEAVIGVGLGLAVSALVSAVAWSGDILGTVSGLAWDDGQEGGASDTPAGVARLARWVALAAFLSAGGLEAVVAGFVDGVRTVPVGLLSHGDTPPEAMAALVTTIPATAIGLAVMLAIPALVAVLAFQLAATTCLRVSACDPGPGLLHAATALVLLVTISVSAAGWSDAAGQRLLPMVSATFNGAPAGGLPGSAGSSGGWR